MILQSYNIPVQLLKRFCLPYTSTRFSLDLKKHNRYGTHAAVGATVGAMPGLLCVTRS